MITEKYHAYVAALADLKEAERRFKIAYDEYLAELEERNK